MAAVLACLPRETKIHYLEMGCAARLSTILQAVQGMQKLGEIHFNGQRPKDSDWDIADGFRASFETLGIYQCEIASGAPFRNFRGLQKICFGGHLGQIPDGTRIDFGPLLRNNTRTLRHLECTSDDFCMVFFFDLFCHLPELLRAEQCVLECIELSSRSTEWDYQLLYDTFRDFCFAMKENDTVRELSLNLRIWRTDQRKDLLLLLLQSLGEFPGLQSLDLGRFWLEEGDLYTYDVPDMVELLRALETAVRQNDRLVKLYWQFERDDDEESDEDLSDEESDEDASDQDDDEESDEDSSDHDDDEESEEDGDSVASSPPLPPEILRLADSIKFYIALNAKGRRLLHDESVPMKVWPLILENAVTGTGQHES